MFLRNFVYLPTGDEPVPFSLQEEVWKTNVALPYLEALIDSTLFERQRAVWDGQPCTIYFDERGALKPFNRKATDAIRAGQEARYREARRRGDTETSEADFRHRLNQMFNIGGDAFVVLGTDEGYPRPYLRPGLPNNALLSLSHDVLRLPQNRVYAGATFEEAIASSMEAIQSEEKNVTPNILTPQVRHVCDDPLGDLVEALRVGEVTRMVGRPKYLARERNTDRWAVPSYDFGTLLCPDSTDYIGDDLCLEARTAVNKGLFKLLEVGLSDFAVIRRANDANGSSHHSCMITLFTEDGKADHYLGAYYRSGYKWVIDDRDLVSLPEALEAATLTLMAVWLLANRKTRYEMATPPSPASRQRVNAGRAKGGRKLLPAVQVIYLTKVERIDPYAGQRQHQGGTHASPRPHDRASNGYSRTYKKTGLTKWYPGPIKVRGGKEAADPVRYEVRP